MTIRKIVLLAFLLRLGWALAVLFLNPDGIWVYDSYGYWYLAKNLLEHGVFSQCASLPFDPDYFRTPLYPILISLFQLLHLNNFFIVLAQAILSAFTCYFTMRICEEIFQNRKIVFIAGLIIALDFSSIIFSNFILTETLFSFLFSVYCLFFVRFLKSNERKFLFYASFFCGLLILCRPIAVFIPVIQAAVLLFRRKKIFIRITISVFLPLIIISPWLIRNKIAFGEFSISYLPSHNLMNHHAANVIAEKENISYMDAEVKFRTKMIKQFSGDALKQPAEFAGFIRNESMKIIFNDFGIFLKQHVQNVFGFFAKPIRSYIDFQIGNKNTSILTKILVVLQIILLTIIYAAFLKGIFSMKQQLIFLLFFLLLIFYFANMTVPPFSEARLRIPAMPLIAVISAMGFYHFRVFLSSKIF
ncbi:MAG: glycosyltransferase family 39 protein [Bacteroidetes bacterium]|nr:glycosyltransferase family 39 protein [Bacteroidota bacterium]